MLYLLLANVVLITLLAASDRVPYGKGALALLVLDVIFGVVRKFWVGFPSNNDEARGELTKTTHKFALDSDSGSDDGELAEVVLHNEESNTEA